MSGFKVGQLAVSKREGTTIQIRRTKVQDGELLLGVGRRSMCWVFAKDYEKYKRAEK